MNKAKYIKDLVDKFDKEDMSVGLFLTAESAVGPILGDLTREFLQVIRLTENAEGDRRLTKICIRP